MVGEAAQGKDAFFLLKNAVSPHLVIISCNFNDTDGLSLARQLLQLQSSLSIVLYVNIPGSSQQIAEQARAIGIRSVLRNQYNPQILLDAVENALQRSLFSAPTFRVFGTDAPPELTPQERLAMIQKDLKAGLPKASPANRILIADSAPFLQMTMSQSLTKAGYVITGKTADDGECLRMLAEQKPDLAIVSCEAPESSFGGISLVRKIQKQDPSVSILLRINREKYPDIAAQKDTLLKEDTGAPSAAFCTPFQPYELIKEADQLLRYRIDRPWFGRDTAPAVKQGWPRVAVIDDYAFRQHTILMLLDSFGYQAVGVTGSDEAGERLCQEVLPDLVIAGYETLQNRTDCMDWIRRIRQPENAPRLILCIDPGKTPDYDQIAQAGIRAGASVCMPFSTPDSYSWNDSSDIYRCFVYYCRQTNLKLLHCLDDCLRPATLAGTYHFS